MANVNDEKSNTIFFCINCSGVAGNLGSAQRQIAGPSNFESLLTSYPSACRQQFPLSSLAHVRPVPASVSFPCGLFQLMLVAAKYGDFAKSVNDFFSRDFPSGVVKLEAHSHSRSLLGARLGKSETFSDEFKVSAARDLATGTIAAEVKNTTVFPLNQARTGIRIALVSLMDCV